MDVRYGGILIQVGSIKIPPPMGGGISYMVGAILAYLYLSALYLYFAGMVLLALASCSMFGIYWITLVLLRK